MEISPSFFFVLFIVFYHYYRNSFESKKVSICFKIYLNTSMKTLYLKGYKWLLSQNEQVRHFWL